MDKRKKTLIILFVTLLMMNLQFNTLLTKGMENGFSLSKLVENVFLQEVYAESGNTIDEMCSAVGCPGGTKFCADIFFPNNTSIRCFKQ